MNQTVSSCLIFFIMENTITLPSGKKIYFASDFHLGAPNQATSLEREMRIIRWLDSIEEDAHTIFLVGDIFDFWFEYKNTIPKGFIRFQGKLAALKDAGIEIIFFTGNHDLWMFQYFTEQLCIPVYRTPQRYVINGTSFLIGHGDGLGPGDNTYKFLKKVFENKLCQWLFAWLHPNIGVSMASSWSNHSRASNAEKNEEKFLGEREHLWQYSKTTEAQQHHDYYVFGHRHLFMNLKVAENSRYLNLGEWVSLNSFCSFDGIHIKLNQFETPNNDLICVD